MAKSAKKPRRRASASKAGPKDRKRNKSLSREYVEAILLAVALALFLRTFVVQAFRIPSGSMEDSLLVGDFLLANKFIYGAKIPLLDVRLPGIQDPKAGDVIIFQYPKDPDRDFIKRCVAGPGQTVELRNKILYVDGKRTVDPPRSKYTDPVILPKDSAGANRDNLSLLTVPEGHYFMMGDNRDNSEDSRFWGFLSERYIRGKALILYWSWAPDANAPEYKGLLSVPSLVVYNTIHLFSRSRWSRIGKLIH